ncbi:MAG: Asp-tRNA(Asn)/Glu-tRNA(Gln) amidotransferase subunit GatA [Fusobacteriaceae bacterium]
MDILSLSAYEIREKILARQITSEEVTKKVFEKIERIDGQIGSFVSLRKESALSEAREIDRKISAGEKVGSLAGVPVAIKDNMVSVGEFSTSSSNILKGFTGVYDATVVKKLKDAGAIIIGNTNMDEFAMGSSTKTSAYHLTKNPWDLERVPGGSSGGSASAVSAEQVYITLGSDTGGSIRQPASFTGTVGLKPTYGRVSRHGIMALASSLDQVGPFTKNVRDAALCMNVISGADEYDSTALDIPVEDYTKYLGQSVKGMKVGIPKEYFIEGMHPGVKEVVMNAIDIFKSLGAEIVEVSLPHTKYSVSTYYVIQPAEASSNLAKYDGIRYGYRSSDAKTSDEIYTKSRSQGFGDEVKRRIMIGTYVLSAGFFDAYFKKAQKVRRLIKNDFDVVFKNVDILLTPVSPTPAFKLTDVKTPVELYLEDIFTIPANMAGLPGLVVPAGKTEHLPVGVQFIGKPFGEGELFRAGDAFERALEEKNGKWKFPIL